MTFLACEPFADVDAVLAREECKVSADDTDLILDALDAASDMVYIMSGGKVTGRCVKTMRPLRRAGCTEGRDAWFDQYGVDCIPLVDNLISVDLVKINGVGLNLADYGLLDNTVLFRKDKTFWPTTNDLKLADTEDGTFSITIAFGWMPDWLAVSSTVEVALALIDDYGRGRGYLRGVTSGNVQGASVQLAAAAGDVASRGLPMLTKFLGVYAPLGGMAVGVWAPELENGWVLVEVEGPSGS